MMYLNCHTYYSLRYGTLSPQELVETARRCGIGRLALTDINNCTAMPEFVRACKQQEIVPVAGMEFRHKNRLLYVVLARNNEGFRRINAFLSQHNMSGRALPERFPVCEHTYAIYPFHPGGPGAKTKVPQKHNSQHTNPPQQELKSPHTGPSQQKRTSPDANPPQQKHTNPDTSPPQQKHKSPHTSPPQQERTGPGAGPAEPAEGPGEKHGEWHPHEFTGVQTTRLHQLHTSGPANQPPGLVALHPVTFAGEEGYQLHRRLRAIDNNILLGQLQPGQCASPAESMLPATVLKQHYADFPHIVENTEALLADCQVDFEFGKLKNKQSFTGHSADDRILLQKLAIDGLKRRYGSDHREAQRRVEHELRIIHELGFSAYFLITWDIIRYSMSCGFYHVGRGSGANSIVAYCLQITDVDPIALDLYFERFINPKRSTPPDFDIDYSWKERDQVLDYVFKRYGSGHTALLGTISTFHRRSAIREMGKVYGLPKEEIDELVSSRAMTHTGDAEMAGSGKATGAAESEGARPGRDTGAADDEGRTSGKNPATASRAIDSRTTATTPCQEEREARQDVTREVVYWAGQLLDRPNIRSIHAGGVLVSEQPICCYSALDLPPKGMPTVQWDMYTAEELGFEKIDILSQRGIGHIREGVRLIRENRGREVDIHRMEIIREDPAVKTLLQRGETIGCFYVESPAMRSLLRKLRCDNYTKLVAASSIIRPGVSRSGMMQEYIRRSHQPDQISYLHPVMEEQLSETYGVMVYQEDVIKVCHHFAGLDLADADVLRRAMSGKYRSKEEMQKLVERFFQGCRAKKHPESLAREVWRQIESFAGYSFSKAHSASFAVESLQSLYLKAHYPLEFITAVINNFGGFYRSEMYFHEARRAGAHIDVPCINKSLCLNHIEGNVITIGFVHLQHLEHKTATQVIAERKRGGPYASLEDFVRRTAIPMEQLLILIRINALRFTGIPKQQLMWQAYLLNDNKASHVPHLFPPESKEFQFPRPENDALTDAWDEVELLGFPVTASPFDMLQSSFRGDISACDMTRHQGQKLRMVGWLVNTKYVRTVKGEVMFFGCFTDHHGHFFDSVHFPSVNKEYPFRGSGIYLLKGRLTQEFGHPSLSVQKMARLPLKPRPGT